MLFESTHTHKGSEVLAGLEQVEGLSPGGVPLHRGQEAACFSVVGKWNSVPMWVTKGEHTVPLLVPTASWSGLVLGYEPDNLLTLVLVTL